MRLNVFVLIAHVTVIVLYFLDLYMCLTIARLLLSRFYADRPSAGFPMVRAITDPVPDTICRWMQAFRRKPIPAWLPWSLVLSAGLILRYLVVEFIREAL